MAARMTGVSWHQGCPVSLSNLRLLTMSYRDFDGRPQVGQMIVNAAVAGPVVSVFRRLYALRFPIRRMVPVDDYGGDRAQCGEPGGTMEASFVDPKRAREDIGRPTRVLFTE
jgi:hypothetical protein